MMVLVYAISVMMEYTIQYRKICYLVNRGWHTYTYFHSPSSIEHDCIRTWNTSVYQLQYMQEQCTLLLVSLQIYRTCILF